MNTITLKFIILPSVLEILVDNDFQFKLFNNAQKISFSK